jgi:hypothetical protein
LYRHVVFRDQIVRARCQSLFVVAHHDQGMSATRQLAGDLETDARTGAGDQGVLVLRSPGVGGGSLTPLAREPHIATSSATGPSQ